MPTQAWAIFWYAHGHSLILCIKLPTHTGISVILQKYTCKYSEMKRITLQYCNIFRMFLNDYLLVTFLHMYCFVYASLHMTFLSFSVQTGSGTDQVS
jgi:hypothetical protein